MKSNESDINWFSVFLKTEEYQKLKANPVAYFCAEYALSPSLPTYAGGLGILSGDYAREAGARDFPMISIGLLYRHAQSMLVTADRSEQEISEGQKLSVVLNDKGENEMIRIPIGERIVSAIAWKWQEKNASVYLLDTNIPENDPADRGITGDLYTDNRADRLRQEILLGIGGFELIKQLGHAPSVYHMNEGHSAFVAMALIGHVMEKQNADFETAWKKAKSSIFYTNHTLVIEGQEQFTVEMIKEQLGSYAKSKNIPIHEIVNFGVSKNSNMFSMTTFAFKMSAKSNAVSVIHGEKANILWPDDHPNEVVTNGIYIPRWDKIKEEAAMWDEHQRNKEKLLETIYQITKEKLDPNTLLFGWARRFVEYKQPLAFLRNIERLKKMADDTNRPLRIVYAGPTGADPRSNSLVAELENIIATSLSGLVTFLPNYNVFLAQQLVSGCDIWMNTPVIGREACGTSGMKAALNGVLPLSTRDGWVAEVDLNDCGWVIDEPNITEKLLDVAEQKIIPMYYEHIKNPKDSEWLGRMKNSRKLINDQFGMSRALREYIEKMYLSIF